MSIFFATPSLPEPPERYSRDNEAQMRRLVERALRDIAAAGQADLSGRIFYGAGSPEGVVVAPVGSLYLRSNGGTNTTFYVKETGTGNTGWVAK